ncbi:MAG: RNA polymerase sigma factor [Phycisphaerales bacterium]
MPSPPNTPNAKAIFEILVRENTDMLMAYLRSTVDDSSAIDDLFQETMIVAWKRINDYDRSRPFGPWLRGIARMLVLAHYRTLSKSPAWNNTEILDTIESRFQEFLTQNGRTFSEQAHDLLNCMKRLSSGLKQIVELLYARDMSHTQIAAALNEQAATIRKRAQRARAQLYECMKSTGEHA